MHQTRITEKAIHTSTN